MKTLFHALFTLTLVLYLAFFIGMVRDSLRWLKRHRKGTERRPYGIALVQSPSFTLCMGTMIVLFGLSGSDQLAFTAPIWPQPIPWWVGVIFGGGLSIIGLLQALGVNHQRAKAQPFDERAQEINLHAGNTALWILWVYILIRGAFEFGAGLTPEEISAQYLQLFIANPWVQTAALFLLAHGLAQAYYSKKMS